ncbi:hypothetical protein BDV98DRAFT_530085 [Pterulicium gracile]|uniref:DUF1772-domain-containing protein n=1 Tax=Pterulicium gracile TaxID=1884261 RepID=A0A5C3QHY3_9AGAR|nr:hypothetical protein BDV98DRAFT_530085 [Pterula gracilis]
MTNLGALTIAPHALLNRLGSPFIASVGLGLAFSSYFFLGNIGCATSGVVPSLKVVELEDEKKVQLWAFAYDSGAPLFATSAVVSGLSYFTAAYLATPMYTSLKPWLVIAGLCSFFAPPWTLLIMASTNKPLLAARDRVLRNEKLGLKGLTATQRIDYWSKLHLARISASGVAWVIGLGAIILA